ncbi:speckle-type POZ protein-like [Leptopilina boulardi]|uniref:speckle-type POZ protein-like n=1 Tax=Leptopilina boulardi TaxID=63433 RepID=UPI0021F61CDB|nr:speckle-type POZ protein-like [Leptopilina boulardi]
MADEVTKRLLREWGNVCSLRASYINASIKLLWDSRELESVNTLQLLESSSNLFWECGTGSKLTKIKNPLSDSLKCNDLVENIASLLDDENFKDVTFKIEKQELTAHKAILANQSPVFAAMFNNKMNEQLTSEVEINDIKPEVFQKMLQFIYCDQVDNLDESALELYYVADKYQLEKLKIMCIKSLQDNLSSETVVNTLDVADLYSISKLKNKCLNFLNKECEIMNTIEFKQLVQERPHLCIELVKVEKVSDENDDEEENKNCYENWTHTIRAEE